MPKVLPIRVLVAAGVHRRVGEQLLQLGKHHGTGGMCAVLAEFEAELDQGLLAGHCVSISTFTGLEPRTRAAPTDAQRLALSPQSSLSGTGK
ncbi:hypothetical protein D3C78_1839770 [compost metagenome]